MNVLITCAGRRTSLLRAFSSVIHDRGGIIIAADTDGIAPAVMLADVAIQTPPLNDPGYIDYLKDVIKKRNIGLVVPTIDTELMLLANNKAQLEQVGCTLLVSSTHLIEVLRDKYTMTRVFIDKGIKVPQSWILETLDDAFLPEELFIKPRDGSASKNVYSIHKNRLQTVLPMVPNPIIQEAIKGTEITVDALLDMEGHCIHYVPRKRIKTLAGESVQGVTIDDKGIREWLLSILAILSSMGGIGPMTIQAFLTSEGPVLSEINPRFGGGVPLAFAAGGHYPEWIIQMLEGEHVPKRIGDYTKGLWMTRYHNELFTENPLWT